ncbi:unnamed protein product [Durusdinium trenchii]|uniref:Uncharacterized protein n=1 Tax=Durusdinium trenchii TaxID=1381693 RepID=A0ABP0PLS3_9DINO
MTSAQKAWLQSPPTNYRMREDLGMVESVNLVPPQACFAVKGWNRSLALLGVCYCAFQTPALLEARSFSTIYANSVEPDITRVVNTNRGVTMSTVGVRRRPNAFNIVWQLELLVRSGVSEQNAITSLEAMTYETAAQVASVYSLGKMESAAAVALLHKVPKPIKEAVTNMVRFDLRHGDGDIGLMLESSVPPPDLLKISIFSHHLQKFSMEAEKQNRDRAAKTFGSNETQLSQQLLQTTMEQLKLTIEGDLMKLRQWMGRWDVFASQQGMLDVKYMEDRYLRGKTFCNEFLESRHKLLCLNQLNLGHAAIVSMQSEMGPDTVTIIVMDCTLWPSRHLLIDEAISLSHAISSGNTNTLCFACLPQIHSSTTTATVMKNRRLLEDKLLACMGSKTVRRRRFGFQTAGIASMAGTSPTWQRSRSLLGSLNGIPRSRVQDLQNPDPDHPLAPHWRVQQRGIKATTQIIAGLLEGVVTTPKQPVLIVDLLPTRFAEWGRAAWNLQKRLLNDEDLLENHPEIRFAALYHADNAADHTNCKEAVTGLIMSEHWDCSDQAGSKSRGRAAFGEPLPSLETLAVVDGEVKTLNNQLVVHQSVFFTVHGWP